MSETERKTEENESSSDEEPPPGELDKPIVILYNKRAKKVRYRSIFVDPRLQNWINFQKSFTYARIKIRKVWNGFKAAFEFLIFIARRRKPLVTLQNFRRSNDLKLLKRKIKNQNQKRKKRLWIFQMEKDNHLKPCQKLSKISQVKVTRISR